MESPIEEKVAGARSLREALLCVVDEPALTTGVLKVSEGPIRGSVCFSKGSLVGAFLHNTGESGKSALRKLLLLDRASIRLTAANRKLAPSGDKLSVNFKLIALPGDVAPRGLPSGAGRYEQLLRIQTAEEELRSFEVFTGALDTDLSDEQKVVLEALAAFLNDKDSFEEMDHQLQMNTLAVRSEQLQSLANALMTIEDAPASPEQANADGFHKSDYRLQDFGTEAEADRLTQLAQASLARSLADEKMDFARSEAKLSTADIDLTPAQMDALGRAILACARRTHGAEFEASNALLQDAGSTLTTQQMRRLREALLARSAEIQKQEFVSPVESLETCESEQLYAFVEPSARPLLQDDDLDAIPTPKVIDADRQALTPAAHQMRPPVRSTPQGIIARARDAFTFKMEQWEARSHNDGDVDSQRLGGFIVLCIVALLLVLVPGLILMSNSGKSASQLEQERWKTVERAEQSDELLASRAKSGAYQLPAHVADPAAATESAGNSNELNAASSQPLRLARLQAQQGRYASAVSYYASYLEQFPDSIAVRVEFIEVLLAAKEKHRAQQLCLATLKRKMSQAEFKTVWQLTRQALNI